MPAKKKSVTEKKEDKLTDDEEKIEIIKQTKNPWQLLVQVVMNPIIIICVVSFAFLLIVFMSLDITIDENGLRIKKPNQIRNVRDLGIQQMRRTTNNLEIK